MQDEFVALFCRKDSAYKKRPHWNVYDIDRDAKTYNGTEPVVCHPPCRAWGIMKHLANPRPGERELAIWSIEKIKENGGILEHPKTSGIWKYINIGTTIEIDQYDFGHVAHKPTKLWIYPLMEMQLPPLPGKDTSIHLCEKGYRRSINGNVEGTKNCTQYMREYTPEKLIDWFEETLRRIKNAK